MKYPDTLPISIIIPSKNENENIHRLLQDIRRQNMQPFEIIVADALSEDNTAVIAKEFGAKVIKGGWPSIGRNNGAHMSKQNILLFLDADIGINSNTLLSDTYENFCKRDLHCASCYFEPLDKYRSFNTISTTWIMNRFKDVSRLPIKGLKLGFGAFLMVKKEAFISVGGFREDMRYFEDSQFIRDLSYKNFKFGILPFKVQLNLQKETVENFKKKSSLVFAFIYGLLSLFLSSKKLLKKAQKLYLSVEKESTKK